MEKSSDIDATLTPKASQVAERESARRKTEYSRSPELSRLIVPGGIGRDKIKDRHPKT